MPSATVPSTENYYPLDTSCPVHPTICELLFLLLPQHSSIWLLHFSPTQCGTDLYLLASLPLFLPVVEYHTLNSHTFSGSLFLSTHRSNITAILLWLKRQLYLTTGHLFYHHNKLLLLCKKKVIKWSQHCSTILYYYISTLLLLVLHCYYS